MIQNKTYYELHEFMVDAGFTIFDSIAYSAASHLMDQHNFLVISRKERTGFVLIDRHQDVFETIKREQTRVKRLLEYQDDITSIDDFEF
jgi:hypothetical protein